MTDYKTKPDMFLHDHGDTHPHEQTAARSKKYLFTEVSERLGIQPSFIIHCVELHWVEPAEAKSDHPASSPSRPSSAPGDASYESLGFDDEDLARLQLIHDLREGFGVNDESVPIILHLLDQLYHTRGYIINLTKAA